MINLLPWDSEFFGLRIGLLEFEESACLADYKDEINDFDLLYILSSDSRKQVGFEIAYQGTRVELEIFPSLFSFDSSKMAKTGVERLGELSNKEKQTLFFLARGSGHCSRFFWDPILKADFNRLYNQWMQLILDRKDMVWVYRENGILMGMVTLQLEDSQGELGLMAVREGCQRNGIGKALFQYLILQAQLLGLKKISVNTQGENIVALDFYKKMGFRQVGKKNVYHWHSPKLQNKKG